MLNRRSFLGTVCAAPAVAATGASSLRLTPRPIGEHELKFSQEDRQTIHRSINEGRVVLYFRKPQFGFELIQHLAGGYLNGWEFFGTPMLTKELTRVKIEPDGSRWRVEYRFSDPQEGKRYYGGFANFDLLFADEGESVPVLASSDGITSQTGFPIMLAELRRIAINPHVCPTTRHAALRMLYHVDPHHGISI